VSAFLAGRGSCKRGSGERSKSLWWRCSGIESGGKGGLVEVWVLCYLLVGAGRGGISEPGGSKFV
jgi:hypothetical protein